MQNNYYDVTQWHVGNPYEYIGEVINSIIADVKSRQTETDKNDGGKPGAVIYVPPGDYRLTTQIVIDISYLKIMGSGHGFTSSSIRFNVPENEWKDFHELWPGGSRIMVDLKPKPGETGIYVAGEQDSFRINGMGLVYLEHGVTVYHADALSIHDNFIAECGSCIELRGWGQASKVNDNLLGAGFKGYTIYAQNWLCSAQRSAGFPWADTERL